MCTVPGDHFLLFVGSASTAAQVPAGRGEEVQTVVLKRLVGEGEQDLERGTISITVIFHDSCVSICAAEPPDLCEEFDFLVMGRFVCLPTCSHGLWIRNNKST